MRQKRANREQIGASVSLHNKDVTVWCTLFSREVMRSTGAGHTLVLYNNSWVSPPCTHAYPVGCAAYLRGLNFYLVCAQTPMAEAFVPRIKEFPSSHTTGNSFLIPVLTPEKLSKIMMSVSPSWVLSTLDRIELRSLANAAVIFCSLCGGDHFTGEPSPYRAIVIPGT